MTVREIADKYLDRIRGAGPDNIVALCPFHDDATPSFAMSTITGLWICYACGVRGNLRQFLQGMGLNDGTIDLKYRSTLEQAQKARPKQLDPRRPNVVTKEPIPESVLGLFQLHHPSLLNAGFTEETLKYFEVGFDKWHNRITYPLRDIRGNLVGINGRAVDDDMDPRYKVYTKEYSAWHLQEREVVNKSSVLWNGHSLYPYISFNKSPEFIVLVEGYKACMWVHQHGVKDVVALQTMSMSNSQKWILERIGAPVYLMLDNNAPGWAGMSAIAHELAPSLPVRIVDYDSEQPDGIPGQDVVKVIAGAKDWLKVLLEVT